MHRQGYFSYVGAQLAEHQPPPSDKTAIADDPFRPPGHHYRIIKVVPLRPQRKHYGFWRIRPTGDDHRRTPQQEPQGWRRGNCSRPGDGARNAPGG